MNLFQLRGKTMVRPRITRATTVVVASVVLWGCAAQSTAPTNASSNDQSVSNASPSNQQIDADVAAAAAPSVATTAADLLSGESIAGGLIAAVPSTGTGVSPAGGADPCAVYARRGTLTFGHDSVTFDRAWEYFAAAGCQSASHPTSTDSIAFATSLVEADHDSHFVVRAARAWQYSVFGTPTLVEANAHVWNGAGAESDTVSYTASTASSASPGDPRTYSGSAVDTATAVTFPHPLSEILVPTSGTFSAWIDWTMQITADGAHQTSTVDRHIVITFNGTSDVPLKIYNASSGALELTCTLDLMARRIVAGTCH
jgi:hypothetical protein